MDVAFALFLPLIAGYLYVSDCAQIKYLQSRDEGHRLYFRIAYYGLLLFLVSAAIVGGIEASLVRHDWFRDVRVRALDLISPLLRDQVTAPAQIGFMLTCVLSVALGRLLPLLDNTLFRGRVEEAVLKAAALDELELLLLEAAVQYKSVSITVSSGKVYVGLVLQTPEPKTNRRVIALLPFMSGYRNDLGKVVFTTFYDEVYQQRASERDDDESNDFRLILPIEKLVSVAFFDIEVYAAFNGKEQPPPIRRVKVPKRQGWGGSP